MKAEARKYLLNYYKRHWVIYVLGAFTVFATSITEVAMPKLTQWCIDLLMQKDVASAIPQFMRFDDASTQIKVLTGILFCLLVFAIIMRAGWRQTLARKTHDAGYSIKVDLWDTLKDVPMKTLQKYSLGDLMSRASADWNSSRNIFGFSLVLTFDLIFFTTLAITLMFSIDWQLTLLALLTFPLMPPLVSKLARKEHDQHIKAQDKLSTLSDLVSQSLNTIRLQRASGSEQRWRSQLEAAASDYASERYRVAKIAWQIFPISSVPTLIAIGLLFVIGIGKLRSGQLSIGEFVAMQSYIVMLQGPLFELGNLIGEWQRGLASLGRILEIYNLKPKPRSLVGASKYGSEQKTPAEQSQYPALYVNNLNFKYSDEQGQVLNNLKFELKLGESLGILGPIGAGKSTLLKLISRTMDPQSESVFVFGRDVTQFDRKDISEYVTMVPQKTFLFATTIRQNLQLDLMISDQKLWEILEIVSMRSEVSEFSQGLDTKIGEWGISLSGGQRQRLALARALLRPKPILLLDDCLSAVDAATEEAILNGLKGTFATQAVIWVAHRMSTLRFCSRIFQMNDGSLSLLNQNELARPSQEV